MGSEALTCRVGNIAHPFRLFHSFSLSMSCMLVISPNKPLEVFHCFFLNAITSGSLVELTLFVRRVIGSTPALVVGALSKSFAHSYLWGFGVKCRHSIRAVSGAALSSS